MRDFEKISFDQFKKDVKDDLKLYNSFTLPYRSTKHAAAYDIFLLEDLELQPGKSKKIPTGIKSRFQTNEMLLLIIRHSLGFKYNLRLVNQVGLIDSDYYNNQDNEGHIILKIQNEGDKTFFMPAGQAIVQGIFANFLTTDSDTPANSCRKNHS